MADMNFTHGPKIDFNQYNKFYRLYKIAKIIYILTHSKLSNKYKEEANA